MTLSLTGLPLELLEAVLLRLFDSCQTSDSSAILRANRYLYDVALPLRHRRLTLTSRNVAVFPLLPEARAFVENCWPDSRLQPSFFSTNVRSLELNLSSFAMSAHYRTPCCQQPFAALQSTTGQHYLRGGEWTDKINGTLQLLADILPSLTCLKSFKVAATRKRGCLGCIGERPFLRENALCAMVAALPDCTQLHELEIDTQDAEVYASNSFFTDFRHCNEHLCKVIAKTVVRLPALRTLLVRRAEICATCFDFKRYLQADSDVGDCCHGRHVGESASELPRPAASNLSNIRTIVLDLRTPDLFHVCPNVNEARARDCNTFCPCDFCQAAAESNHTATPSPTKEAAAKLASSLFHQAGQDAPSTASPHYGPWPVAYLPATPNVFMHWHHVHAQPAAASQDQQQDQAEVLDPADIARREHLESFVTPLLSQIEEGILPNATSVKVLVNGNPGSNQYRQRLPMEMDLVTKTVARLYSPDKDKEEKMEVDCEGTALQAQLRDFQARELGCLHARS